MFEENEFQSIHILFVSFILIIVYFVWKSTEVRREIQPFENIQTFAVRRSSSLLSNASTASNSTTIEENLTSSVEELAQNIFSEASESFNALNEIERGVAATENGDEEDETSDGRSDEERIISAMDHDIQPVESRDFGLRNRRRPSLTQISSSTTTTTTTSANEVISDRSDLQLSEEALPATMTTTTTATTTTTTTTSETLTSEGNENIQMIKDADSKISIKLKYLNDEIKTVECYLNESLGNFKKRNFKTELESKLIKLIFNGKLLEDDKKSMQQCGIFSEAVVHCLVLQKKSQVNASVVNQNANANRQSDGSFINNINFEWNIIGMVLVCLTLVICWYCRLQYAYFSWYSTIGLVLLTSLFIFLIPLFTRVFS